jgi:hypothetical protein
MPAVLIVAFARPANLMQILSVVQPLNVKVYVFVDKSDGKHSLLNEQTRDIAAKLAITAGFELTLSETHFGVGKAVPAAMDWAFQSTEDLVILEDDCIPSEKFFEFVSQLKDQVGAKTKMISGINLIPENRRPLYHGTSTICSYPSIWGWYTTRESWKQISVYLEKKPRFHQLIGSVVLRPSKISALGYFYAASIRTYKSEVEAWDCQIALAMLIHRYVSIIPSGNLVKNIGADQVSSHTMISQDGATNVVAGFEGISIGREPDLSQRTLRANNRALEQEVYRIRSKHMLSPIKAWLKIGKS